MPHSVVVTAMKTGPDRAVTETYPDVTSIEFDFMSNRLLIGVKQGVGDNIKEFDLKVVAAVTFTPTAGIWAVAIA